jgi:hypothetical protein
VTAVTKPNYSLREIPGGVWALGFVSMLMDVSSEMIHAWLPVYLVTVLGTSTVTVFATPVADRRRRSCVARPTDFSIYRRAAMLAASVIAGALWDATGPKGTFVAGACFASLALGGLLAVGALVRRVAIE